VRESGGGVLENFVALELLKQFGWSKLQPVRGKHLNPFRLATLCDRITGPLSYIHHFA